MATESKKHHFVPRSLLKNFYNEECQLFVFDKTTGKSFPTTTENAGHENYFNSISIGSEKFNFEAFYETIDADQATLVQKILLFDKSWNLSEAEIWKLAYFTLVQMHRTKLSRTSLVEFSHQLQDWMNDLTRNSTYEPVNSIIDPEESKIIALQQVNEIPEHIHHLLARRLNIVKAPLAHPFYCSDNPVVMHNPYPYGKVALGGVGTDISFPLSRTLLVNFTCASTARKIYDAYDHSLKIKQPLPEPVHHAYRSLYERKIVELEPKFVDFFNHLQVAHSSRFLYSSKNDFTVARKMIDASPKLKEVKTIWGLGSRPFPDMPIGEQIVFFLEDRAHTMIRVEIIDGNHDLYFRVSEEDAWKIEVLWRSKEPIEYVQVFKDKMERRFMRDVEIVSYDSAERTAVISHKDKGLTDILKMVKENRLKHKRNAE